MALTRRPRSQGFRAGLLSTTRFTLRSGEQLSLSAEAARSWPQKRPKLQCCCPRRVFGAVQPFN
eukprot:scaffold1439_cov282-Pinguiococcus_pyrenoidosus.AAC.6